MTCCGSFA